MKKDRLDYEFLPEAGEIEETPPSPFGRIILWTIVLVMVAAFLWSYFGKVDEEVVTRGKVIPDGMVKVIQPRETGVIRAIHVVEGQKVKKGDLLIELDPTMSQAEVESSERSLTINRYDMERLKAELKGEEIDGAGKNLDKLLLLQKNLKQAREDEHRAKVASLELIISQKRTALLSSEESIVKLEKTLELVTKQEEALRQLAEKGYASIMEHLQRQKELVRTEKELNEQRKSAQPIVTIVPEGTPLIVEAMALNKDVGFIHSGQKAELKLDTFPFQKYGTIEAELFFVSPDAQEDKKIGLVYKIKLRPNRLKIRVKEKDIPLSPGMAATAEIKTWERRVIEFFISPFIKHVDESLTLR